MSGYVHLDGLKNCYSNSLLKIDIHGITSTVSFRMSENVILTSINQF